MWGCCFCYCWKSIDGSIEIFLGTITITITIKNILLKKWNELKWNKIKDWKSRFIVCYLILYNNYDPEMMVSFSLFLFRVYIWFGFCFCLHTEYNKYNKLIDCIGEIERKLKVYKKDLYFQNKIYWEREYILIFINIIIEIIKSYKLT